MIGNVLSENVLHLGFNEEINVILTTCCPLLIGTMKLLDYVYVYLNTFVYLQGKLKY